MASYKIEFKRSADKDLRRLAKEQIPRLLDEIRALAISPFPEGSRKLVGGDYTYRIRVGDYRITYQVYRHRDTIEIDRIRHRKDVYRD